MRPTPGGPASISACRSPRSQLRRGRGVRAHRSSPLCPGLRRGGRRGAGGSRAVVHARGPGRPGPPLGASFRVDSVDSPSFGSGRRPGAAGEGRAAAPLPGPLPRRFPPPRISARRFIAAIGPIAARGGYRQARPRRVAPISPQALRPGCLAPLFPVPAALPPPTTSTPPAIAVRLRLPAPDSVLRGVSGGEPAIFSRCSRPISALRRVCMPSPSQALLVSAHAPRAVPSCASRFSFLAVARPNRPLWPGLRIVAARSRPSARLPASRAKPAQIPASGDVGAGCGA